MDIEVLKDVSRFESMEPGQDYVGEFQFLDEDQGVKEVENLRRLRDGKIREYHRQQEDYEARLDRAKLEKERAEEARERMREAEVMITNYDAAIYRANIGLEVARNKDRVAMQHRQERGTKRRVPAGGRGTPVHEPPSRGRGSGSAGGMQVIDEGMLDHAMGRLGLGDGGRGAQRPQDREYPGGCTVVVDGISYDASESSFLPPLLTAFKSRGWEVDHQRIIGINIKREASHGGPRTYRNCGEMFIRLANPEDVNEYIGLVNERELWCDYSHRYRRVRAQRAHKDLEINLRRRGSDVMTRPRFFEEVWQTYTDDA